MTSNVQANPRIQIREGLEQAIRNAGITRVFHYRMSGFNIDELPAARIVPNDADDPTKSLTNVFRRSEPFIVEAALARSSDTEDFAASVDLLYESLFEALKVCRYAVPCASSTIQKRGVAVDERGQVPILLLRFYVSVEFDAMKPY